MAQEDRDPLSPLPPVPHHPATTSSPDSSPLSSVLPSPEKYPDLREQSESILRNYKRVDPSDDTTHVLEAFLKCLSKEGQMNLMTDLVSVPDKLRELRDFLVAAILKPMKMAGGHPPKIPDSPTYNQRGAIEESLRTIHPSSRDDQVDLKNKCRARDGFRCVLSGFYDFNHAKEHGYPEEGSKTKLRCDALECAHILPFALRKFEENKPVEKRNKAWIWWALRRYFPFIQGKIASDSINKPENAITLANMLHPSFGNFWFALEPLGAYRRRTYEGGFKLAATEFIPEIITFQQHDDSVPMPDPDFLRLHFQVAEILDVSGLSWKIDVASREGTRMRCDIAPDGSTDIAFAIRTKMLMDI
ncbi:uncharacterized protein P884DRAFT_274441 [Thermothelomyces heterothallicus CBS 202.75]|uniref:uncharacterized protein n=1 Tax=Thermothelomyces heterothallicus CBS 202.75 TaxID=1149848 RepID=UPI0037432E84